MAALCCSRSGSARIFFGGLFSFSVSISAPASLTVGDQNACRKLAATIRPFRRVPHLMQACRNYIGVEDNHQSKGAGLISCPRSSGISASRPTFVNQEAISVPSPPTGVSSSLAAWRRISRTSSSMLRPCRWARRCSRDLTSISIFRTTSWATGPPFCYHDITKWAQLQQCGRTARRCEPSR